MGRSPGPRTFTLVAVLTVTLLPAPLLADWSPSPLRQPQPRFDHGTAFDEARGRLVLFSGIPSDLNPTPFGDTWLWDGSAWSQASPTASPSGRYRHAMVDDSVRNRVVLFGGLRSTVYLGDTWEWDGINWIQRSPTSAPSPRYDHALAFDAVRGRVVLFGGSESYGGWPDDTWEYDGNPWVQLAPATSPPGRVGHAMVFDSVRSRVLLFGGFSGAYLNDTWEWDGATWTQQLTGIAPSPRSNPEMAFDPVRGRAVLFGGAGSAGRLSDSWEWNGTSWSQRFPTVAPSPRIQHSMSYDPIRQRSVLFGGTDVDSGLSGPEYVPQADLWEWDGIAWSNRSPLPDPREGLWVFEGAAPGQCVAFGGFDNDQHRSDTWTWTGNRWTYAAAANPPSKRYWTTLAFDRARGRGLLFGGHGPGNLEYLNETWEWNGVSWSRMTPAASPTVRGMAAAAYDASRGRVVLFGGSSGDGFPNDTWEWDGINWLLRTPALSPPGREVSGMTYDPIRGRVVLFGGWYGGPLSDTWEWDGTNWFQMSPTTSPSARGNVAFAYDEARGTCLLFGGWNGVAELGDTWEWNGTNWAQVTTATAPGSRFDGRLAFDSVRNRMMLLGGWTAAGAARLDAWNLAPAVSLLVGLGASGGQGYTESLKDLAGDLAHVGWQRLPFSVYNAAVGESRPACGDVDGDGLAETAVGIGTHSSSGGWVQIRDDLAHGQTHLAWIRVPWAAYNAANGETRPALGDLDGDGRAELVVGLGPYPVSGGFMCIFDDAVAAYAARGWKRVPWPAYNAANGETRPACGDVDGDGRAELVVGLGNYPPAGGYTYLFDDMPAGYPLLRLLSLSWPAYNAAGGSTRPALGDIDGDGRAEIVVGIGSYPTSGGWWRVYDDAVAGNTPLAWGRVNWAAYNAANGETRPALGDMDDDGRAEVVIGLGRYTTTGGMLLVYDDAPGGHGFLRTGRVAWSVYNAQNGETWPAVGRNR